MDNKAERKRRSDEPYVEYKGKAEWVDVLRGDFTRNLVNVYLGLKKDILKDTRDIFKVTK